MLHSVADRLAPKSASQPAVESASLPPPLAESSFPERRASPTQSSCVSSNLADLHSNLGSTADRSVPKSEPQPAAENVPPPISEPSFPDRITPPTQFNYTSARLAALRSNLSGTLDIEDTLRLFCESILADVGPTNLAVFLPTASGDHSLGAYVNYSLPKDTVDVLLGILADQIGAPVDHALFDGRLKPNVCTALSCDSLAKFLSNVVYGLDDRFCAIAPLMRGGEVLGILTIFRSDPPFDAKLLTSVDDQCAVFAAALERMVRIHHRHIPHDQHGTTV